MLPGAINFTIDVLIARDLDKDKQRVAVSIADLSSKTD